LTIEHPVARIRAAERASITVAGSRNGLVLFIPLASRFSCCY